MLEVKNFKDESIIILDKKIKEVNDNIISLVKSILSVAYDDIIACYDGDAYIIELMNDLNAYIDKFDKQDKRNIEQLNKKIEEYCSLLKRRILIKIKYGDIAKYEVPNNEENYFGMIFLHQPDGYDLIAIEFGDKVLNNPNEYNFTYVLSSTEYGPIEVIAKKLLKIYDDSKVLSNKAILKKLKPKQKK